MKDDAELLREYATNGSEEAFTALVSRHVGMVYSVAMRQTGNPHQAEEITQAVFVILARKAGSLNRVRILSGWLFHAAQLTASNYLRSELRRRNREQEAFMQSNVDEHSKEDVWNQMAPMLDGAIASLGQKDRDAIVLRFLQGRNFADVGRALGSTESAAQRRISRALERLRTLFTKRGVVITDSMLASLMAVNSAQSAPAGMVTSVATVGMLKGATAGVSTLAVIKGTLNVMAWAKLKFAAGIGAGVALATGTAIVAITYAAEASHALNKAPTLSANSPFVRYLSNPPWIKKMEFARGQFTGTGFQITNDPPPPPVWWVMTNTFGYQPSGSYFTFNDSKPGVRRVLGVNDQNYWAVQEKPKWVKMTPVAPDASYFPTLEGMKPRMEELRYLGLRALRPGTFAMREDGSFTATTLKDELLEGRILKVANDRPLALTYHVVTSFPPDQTRESTVTITYQYASATAPLPASFGVSEVARTSLKSMSRDGRESIFANDTIQLPSTNYILSADYGLDESITNGYSPSMFFPDLAQYQVHIELLSNGVLYIDGAAQRSPGGQFSGQGAVTNRAGK